MRAAGGPADAARPAHLTPALVALVAAGGAVGTAGRYGLALALPVAAGWPLPTLVANVLGAFALGALLEALLAPGTETARARRARLGLGTGALGGFTTFSSLAFEVERLLADGAVATALGYAGATLVLGYAACVLGVGWAARRRRGRRRRETGAAS
ncbi:CrcB family protein [Cellulomonas sp. PhB143]|uniref:FluC/FEX family fluoride channel n=1 Tax=Cellulomonas sp. PhB143 TaxID=2485186 RepID=UPI000F477DE0|nr:CrcB family protein [Cellulomonas sp. PhB143]ROS75258.1 camphor resistance protein CrcB [Cellulomonas sp. PhB143]